LLFNKYLSGEKSVNHLEFKLLSILIISLYSFSNVYAGVQAADHRQKLSDESWEENLRKQNFQEREIKEGAEQNIIELKAPYTAEDASIVPVSIHTQIPQTKDRYIKKMHVFVDKNPMPLVGLFEFTPDSGKADIAMRIRVDTFSYVRAVAELNTGELYMSKSFVRAKGACSAPPPPGMEDSVKLLGKMKMKVVGDLALGEPNLMQVKVRHPNITGMAPLRIGSRIIPPAFFMDTLEVDYNGKPIVKALLTFSVSMDPALRFYFVPEKEGIMTVKGTDTKKTEFSSTHEVKLNS
jgi:sulfur-oxidizing protein SoxY